MSHAEKVLSRHRSACGRCYTPGGEDYCDHCGAICCFGCWSIGDDGEVKCSVCRYAEIQDRVKGLPGDDLRWVEYAATGGDPPDGPEQRSDNSG